MTEPAPGKLDLFERFKEFVGDCTWAVMIARASAETQSQIAPGELERWMRRWLSSSDPRDVPHPASFFGLCRREINRFIEAGRAGRFPITGFAGAEHKTFGSEIWWAVHRIDFSNHRLLLTNGATIVGVRTTTASPQDTPQGPLIADQKSEQCNPVATGRSEPEIRLTTSFAIINRAIQAIYDDAEQKGTKPPNINEIVKPVQQRLARDRRTATGVRIKELADKEPHASRRLKSGSNFIKRL